ncbi:acyltransferase [Photobacterium leiognathi]|uniref:acyltransferase n=1 Tax=Photobacterium leiognathi TaxID=553611 RepID=UPI00298148A3|nr:acyltransferase [Photobacterium leiognathi]
MLNKIKNKTIFEIKYSLSNKISKYITKFFYKSQFGYIGFNSYIKKTDQVIGSKNIFIGDNVRIEKGAVLYAISNYSGLSYTPRIQIGNNVYINRYTNITACNNVLIEDGVSFGPNVFICDFNHSYENLKESIISSPLKSNGSVTIGAGSWLGANVFVSNNVKIGKHCVVAANSVVTKSIDDYCVVAGIPAKVIKKYNTEKEIWEVIK